jgi:DNA primase catalytic core
MSKDLSKIIEACQYLLNDYSEAQPCKEYLDKRLNKNSQELFQFGYFPTIDNIQVLISLVGEDLLRDNSLFYSREVEDSLYPRKVNFSFFENHPLIMPYKDAYGNVVGIVGRSLLSDKERKFSKYKNTDFSKTKHLFGLYENKKSVIENDSVFVVEGQFDTIKAVEKGFTNIVSLGGAGMSDYQFFIISRYTNNIFLLLDNDEAGEKGRKRIIDKFGKYANIHNFYLPEPYKDIDEYLMENSYDSISFVIKE